MKKETVLRAASCVLSAAIVCLAAVQLLGLWDGAIRVFVPLSGVVCLLQSAQFWNDSRAVAVLQLCAAVFVLGVSAYILLF